MQGGGRRPRGDDRAAGGGAFAAVQAKRRAGAQRVEEGKKVEGSQLSRRPTESSSQRMQVRISFAYVHHFRP